MPRKCCDTLTIMKKKKKKKKKTFSEIKPISKLLRRNAILRDTLSYTILHRKFSTRGALSNRIFRPSRELRLKTWDIVNIPKFRELFVHAGEGRAKMSSKVACSFAERAVQFRVGDFCPLYCPLPRKEAHGVPWRV